MNRLTTEKRAQVVRALTEGCSIRSIVRMTGVAKNTVTKLLVDLGTACAAFQDEVMRDLPCKRLEVDEQWAFVAKKEKRVPKEERGQGVGDAWLWTVLCADTKLVASWHLGRRDAEDAEELMLDLAGRINHRVQLTSDGLSLYPSAVKGAFGDEIDFAVVRKSYGKGDQIPGTAGRYSPPKCTGITKRAVSGEPDEQHVSTSYVERLHLTNRMQVRRMTRLTNGFSKKAYNLFCAMALHYMVYNFARPHRTLDGKTPAMAAGVADHRWSIEEVVGLLERAEGSN